MDEAGDGALAHNVLDFVVHGGDQNAVDTCRSQRFFKKDFNKNMNKN